MIEFRDVMIVSNYKAISSQFISDKLWIILLDLFYFKVLLLYNQVNHVIYIYTLKILINK